MWSFRLWSWTGVCSCWRKKTKSVPSERWSCILLLWRSGLLTRGYGSVAEVGRNRASQNSGSQSNSLLKVQPIKICVMTGNYNSHDHVLNRNQLCFYSKFYIEIWLTYFKLNTVKVRPEPAYIIFSISTQCYSFPHWQTLTSGLVTEWFWWGVPTALKLRVKLKVADFTFQFHLCILLLYKLANNKLDKTQWQYNWQFPKCLHLLWCSKQFFAML